MEERLRWGIFSTGTIAQNFAKTALLMGEEIELFGIASRDKCKAETFAKQYGIANAFGTYEDLVRSSSVDVVYIGTPHSRHFEDIMLCLEHGKHVLCEKSFTVTATQAKIAYRTAAEKGLFLMEGFWTKFLPIYRDAEEIIKGGTLGEIHLVTAQYGFCINEERGKRKFDPKLAGGALLDIGVYAIGFAAMVLGYHPTAIQSLVTCNEVGTDSYSSIIMQYESGAIAQLTSAIQTTIPPTAGIYGSKGYMEIPQFKNPERIRIVREGKSIYEIEKKLEINGFEYEIREVVNCIKKGYKSSEILTPGQSIAVMEIMDRVRSIWGMEFPLVNLGGEGHK